MAYRQFFLSYNSNDSGITDIVEEKLGEALKESYGDTFSITRYTHDEHYNENFRKLMESIPGHDAMLSVVSKSYLESPACMYEVSMASKQEDGGKLGFIFPYYSIVLSKDERKGKMLRGKERRKYRSKGRIKDPDLYSRGDKACRYYKGYWNAQLRDVENTVKRKTGSGLVTSKLKTQLEDTDRAAKLIDSYLDYICSTNNPSITEYIKNGFSLLVDKLVSRIDVPQYPKKLPENKSFVENSVYREFAGKLNDEKHVVLTGIPGSGKTENIQKYISEYGHRFRDIVKINCFNAKNMYMDIVGWFGARGYVANIDPENTDLKSIVGEFKKQAKENKGVLFIFEDVMNGVGENADERGIKDIWNEIESIVNDPEIDSCFVAATNQVPANPALSKMLMDCGGLDKEEAKELFFNELKSLDWDYTHIKNDPEGVDKLISELDGNPLAVLQAAKYISATNLSAEEYLKRLAEYPVDVDEQFTELFGGDERNTVEGRERSGLRGLCSSIKMIYDRISKENPLAKELLDRISFMGSLPIDRDFLFDCALPRPDENDKDALEAWITDTRRAMNLLKEYRLVTNSSVEDNSIECKEIIRVLVRTRSFHTDEENNELARSVSEKMYEKLSGMREDELESRKAQLLADHAAYLLSIGGDAVAHRDDLMLYVGNALFLLGSYSACLECLRQINTTDDPERAFKVDFAMAEAYEALSKNDKVIELVDKSLSCNISPSRFACQVRMKQFAAFACENIEKDDKALVLLDEIMNATEDGGFCAGCDLCDCMRQRARAFNCRGNILNNSNDVNDDDKKFEHVRKQYEDALSCLGIDSLVKILDQQGYEKLEPHGLLAASILLNIGKIYSKDMQYDKAEQFMQYAKRLLDKVCSNLFENSKWLVNYYFFHGTNIMNKALGDFENGAKDYIHAVEEFKKCLDISMRCGFSDTEFPFSCYYNLGVLYSQWYTAPENDAEPFANFKKAIEYFNKMMDFKIDERNIIVAKKKYQALCQMAYCYQFLDLNEKSELIKEKAENYAKEHDLY